MNDETIAHDPAGLVAVLRGLVLVGSVRYIALYAILVCFRVRYPFELEWLEGTSIDHVRTILAGKPLYARPSLDFQRTRNGAPSFTPVPFGSCQPT